MRLLKKVLWGLVTLFFSLFFSIFGKPKLSNNLKKTLDLYKDSEFFDLFSLIRVWDSPFEEVNKVVPKKGRIIDLGCGDGALTNYLAISSNERRLTGIEINNDRVVDAYKGLKNTTFRKGDITRKRYTQSDGFVLMHVLHHLPSKDDQIKVLKKLKKSLSKNGAIVVVEIVEKPFIKYAFTWLTDAFIVPILFESSPYDFNFHYRKNIEWQTVFKELDFKYKINKADKNKPFSHIIYTLKHA